MIHVLDTKQFKKEYIENLFQTTKHFTKEFKRDWGCYPLKGKIAGTLFFEPSTRTRWSTEVAMLKLGGQVVSMECAKESSSDKKGESLADTFKICSQYVDILIVRHPESGMIEEAARYSEVPVINAGSGAEEHPTQALIDLYTILQYYPCLKNLTVMFTGDISHSRTIKSLLPLLKLYDLNKIYLHNYTDVGFKGDVYYLYRDEIYHKLSEIDVLYMTRYQQEREGDRQKSDFKMTYQFAEVMKDNAIIMHPLPRNEELESSTDGNKRAVYFQQAKNGLHLRMALLYELLKNNAA